MFRSCLSSAGPTLVSWEEGFREVCGKGTLCATGRWWVPLRHVQALGSFFRTGVIRAGKKQQVWVG